MTILLLAWLQDNNHADVLLGRTILSEAMTHASYCGLTLPASSRIDRSNTYPIGTPA